jgi:hypothetical protein
VKKTGKSEEDLRGMCRKDFQQTIETVITETEQYERLKTMKESSRLEEYAMWLESFSLKQGGLKKRWGLPA